MKAVHRLFAAVVLCPALLISAALPDASAASKDTEAAAIFADIGKDEPGCAAAAMADGKTVWSSGFGLADMETHRAVTPDTLYNIGSVSKQFTAYAILQLAAAGKLSLDDPIRRYVPELRAYADPVTIRHLLHHTGGLQDYILLSMLAGHPISGTLTKQQALDILAAQTAAQFPPGSEFSYSNSGYFLLSVIVERVSGQTMRNYAAEHIFRPFGMQATSIVDRYPAGLPLLARGYAKVDGRWDIDESAWEPTGDGQVHTDVDDLLIWVRHLAQGDALARKMRETAPLTGGGKNDYAMGLFTGSYRGTPLVSHSGGWAGYSSSLIWLPEKRFASVVLCSTHEHAVGKLARKLADLYVPGLGPTEPEEEDVEAKPATPVEIDLSRYAGRFELGTSPGEITMTPEGGKLIASFAGLRIELIPVAPDRFVSEGGEVVFTPDAASFISSDARNLVFRRVKP